MKQSLDVDDVQRRMLDELQSPGLFEHAKQHAVAYLAGVRARAVAPTPAAVAKLSALDEPMPDAPAGGDDILRELAELGGPATVAQLGGRYFGFVNGGAVPAALACRWLTDSWDQNAALSIMSPIASHLEAVCERWLVDLLRLPIESVAGFVSGSSVATLSGLAAGRNRVLLNCGWDVSAKGLFGAPALRVVASEQAHATVFKALSLLGLGRERVELVATDAQGRLITERLPMLDERCLVIAQAGNVGSGAFDPLAEICERARKVRAWVHVDGAFGLWAAACVSTRHLTNGAELADSWSVDAHKTLNAPYDCGIVLCRHRDDLVAAMQATGAYIHYGADRDGMHYTPEMSRRARGIDVWVTLKALGRSGLEELIARLHRLAVRFAESLCEQGFRVLNDVVFNQVLVAGKDAARTEKILRSVQASGECWCGGTVWNGESAIRISVCSWATTAEDVDRSVAAFVAAARSVEN